MAGETILTIVGNLTADPELRTTGTGTQVCGFTIASTPRVWNRQANQYEDGQSLFMRCSAWRDLAGHCAQSLSKGMRVIATGRLSQRSYQAQDGTNRTVVEMTIDEIGPSLRYATAQVTKQGGHDGCQGGSTYGNPAGNPPVGPRPAALPPRRLSRRRPTRGPTAAAATQRTRPPPTPATRNSRKDTLMAKKNDSGLVQDALIPDEMSPLSLLDFNSSCAKIKQAAVDFRRAVNHKMQLETKDAYLDKFHQIDPYTEAVYDTDARAQHLIDCAEVINRLLTYPKDARRAVLYDNLHDSLATFEESAPDYPDPDDDADETDRGEAVDPTTGEIK